MNTKKLIEVLRWTVERITAPFNVVTALLTGAQKHRDDMLEAFRQHNRTMSLKQCKALENISESVEYIAKALAVMNERSVRLDPPTFGPQPGPVPPVVRKPMRKARP